MAHLDESPGGGRDLVVGVIGGMGPDATADFFQKLISLTPAERDQDHLRILIDNNPKIPDRHAAIRGETPSVGPALAASARGLEVAGADFIVMACNTAHAFADDIRAALTVPFISMIDEVIDHVVQTFPDVHAVGLMAAEGCLDASLYQTGFAARGLQTLTWSERDRARFMDLVFRIKGGTTGASERADMKALAEALEAQGAMLLLAGCTEIPLVLDEAVISVPLVSSTDVLAERSVEYARRTRLLPDPAS